MIKFSKLLPNTLYRVKNRYTLPYNDKQQLKGNMIAIFGENISDTADFFADNPYWQFKRYNRYYIDKRLYTQFIGSVIRIKNNQKEIFENNFGAQFPDVKLCELPGLCRDYNTIYELNQYTNIIYNNEKLLRKSLINQKVLKVDALLSKLSSISSTFPIHKKYLMIPVDKYITNPKNQAIWINRNNLNNSLIQFILEIRDNPNKFSSLKDWTFIFSNLNEIFYIECKDINSSTYEFIRDTFKRFRSKPHKIELEDTDDDNMGLTEDENEENIVDVNKTTTVKAATDVVNTINNLPLSEEDKTKLKTKTVGKIKEEFIANSTDEIKTVNEKPTEDSTKEKSLHNSNIIKNNDSKDLDNDINTTSKVSDNKLLSKDKLTSTANNDIKEALNKTILPSQSVQRLARINKIQKEMKEIKVNDVPIKNLAMMAEKKQLKPKPINANVINENIKNIPFNNFEKAYNENLMEYDLTNILMSFSKKDRPLYLISLEKEDTSTAINQLYTYKAVFEDENGTRHNLTFDMPKFVDNKFMHLNGSDKLFINQIIPLPVTKISPDEVQISSNYKKVFISRLGKNVSSKLSKFHKAIPEVSSNVIRFTKGNNIQENSKFMTTIEYDEMSSKYSTITIIDNNITFYFNQSEIRSTCSDYELTWDDSNEIPFAIDESDPENRKLITILVNSDTVKGTDLSPVDYIIKAISDIDSKFGEDFSKTSVGKKYMYTRAKIMNKNVPVVLLLSFLDGLEPLLNRINADYSFTETRPQLKDSTDKSVIAFKDGYLVYSTSPFSNALLLNGLHDIPTEEYDFIDFSNKDIYYSIFNILFGRRNIGDAFENFNQSFIDPITEEVLNDYNLPTNFIDLIIYGNTLLENNTYDLDGDLKNYRIRTNELVNVHLYQVLTKAYESYRLTADNKKPVKFSIKRNDVIKSIYDSQVMEEYSTLNPIYEIDRMRSTSYKGPGGCNVDRAYKLEKRAYNETMLGVLAQSSPISANIGISRILSLNPNIKSTRGYIEPGSNKNIDKINMTNMLSGAEMLVPMTATHDDPQRVAMASTQSRHTISTMDSDVPLFGYGMDKVLPKVISNRFAYKAKSDGIVIEINEKLGYMIVEYNDGKKDVVDISNRQELNTGSGFYINNKLSPVLELNAKFREGDILAVNKDFFTKDDITGDIVYTSGPLTRVAVIHGSCVYEDSTLVSERLAERLSSYITEKKSVNIGKNSNVYHMVKIGDKVKVGDPLIVFDESYNDDYLNKLLAKMNEYDKEDIISSGKTPVKSKYNGQIIDIKIYYTVPKNTLSESLQKVISDYEKPIKSRLNKFNSNGINIKDLTTLNELPEPTEPDYGKIKGVKMDTGEILIEFYIQTVDKFSVGDKITYSTALKGINQSLIPLGEEPYIASDPSEKIDAFMSVSGYYSRMTNSFTSTIALNTVLIGAEKKIADILKK